MWGGPSFEFSLEFRLLFNLTEVIIPLIEYILLRCSPRR